VINGLQGLLQIDNVCSIKSTCLYIKHLPAIGCFCKTVRVSSEEARVVAVPTLINFETVILWKENTLLALFAFENGLVSTLAMASQKLANGVHNGYIKKNSSIIPSGKNWVFCLWPGTL